MDTKVVAGALGEEWKNPVVPVSIAIVKQGFSTKQGVLIHDRLFLLLSNEHSYSKPKKIRERKCKCESVWGCIGHVNLYVLNLVTGERRWKAISAHIDTTLPKRWGQKGQAESVTCQSHQKDDIHQYVVNQPLNKEGLRFKILSLHMSSNTYASYCSKEINTKKNEEEDTEYAKIWSRKWNKPKKNTRNGLPRDIVYPHWEHLLQSPVKD